MEYVNARQWRDPQTQFGVAKCDESEIRARTARGDMNEKASSIFT